MTSLPVRTVAGFNVEAGIIRAFGGRQLFFFDRYRMGGENSLRGFRTGRVVVVDDDGNFIRDEFQFEQGGDRFLQLNLEYHFLVGGPFRIVFFSDGGNVFGAECNVANQARCGEGDFDLGDLRYTAGVEMRILVPVFGAPLRFIYARNLRPLPNDDFESFQFSIGTSF
jgi:outer membrane protein assembly factor BamA